MNLAEFENRYLRKRLKNLEKLNRLRNQFISRNIEAEKDLNECRRIIGELANKLGWNNSIP